MKVIINGEEKNIENDLTVQDLLLKLKLKPEMIAVEKNEEILERENYTTEKINEGDVLELIRFMGGGNGLA